MNGLLNQVNANTNAHLQIIYIEIRNFSFAIIVKEGNSEKSTNISRQDMKS